MCFCRTVGHLVCMLHLFGVTGVTQVQVGGRKAKDSPGGKGVWCVSNLESLATQGHFDQKFEFHEKN